MFEALDVAPEVKYSPLRAGWVDWRNKMTAVKDQGTCGSCWAFATVATIEAQYIIRQNRELNLSEQELLDCSSVGDYSNHGCNGGSAPQALKYVLDHGITTESVYPYRNQVSLLNQLNIEFDWTSWITSIYLHTAISMPRQR